MAEWLKAHAWKACVRETVPWVRIPLSPPSEPKSLYFSALPDVGCLAAHIPAHTSEEAETRSILMRGSRSAQRSRLVYSIF
jgi:hypothetical protein